jgi:CheY-like chemotaxis protein
MPQETAAPQPRIFHVDERAAHRDLVVRALGALNYRVENAATGRDALARAGRDRADLIVLSASLPDMSGAALIGALRRLPGLGRVPIVAICPEHGADLRDACLAAGATAHLPRPLEIERLLRLIGQLLRGPAEVAVAEPVLDVDHLRGFTEGDLQLERELSSLFLSTAEMYLDGMREALTSGRPWTSIAHALKGASANLGARRLSALALLAERSEPDRAQLEAIEHAVEEVRALFAQGVTG